MKKCNRLQLITIKYYDYPMSGANRDNMNFKRVLFGYGVLGTAIDLSH